MDADSTMTMAVVKAIQLRAESTARGQVKACYGPFQGGDQPKPREDLTLKDEYVFPEAWKRQDVIGATGVWRAERV